MADMAHGHARPFQGHLPPARHQRGATWWGRRWAWGGGVAAEAGTEGVAWGRRRARLYELFVRSKNGPAGAVAGCGSDAAKGKKLVVGTCTSTPVGPGVASALVAGRSSCASCAAVSVRVDLLH